PEVAWPSYAFVPGRGLPHPVRDPLGHLFDTINKVEKMNPDQWHECRAYLQGVDLFNYGFYWEAHEAWESIWRAYDRSETLALFLQGLIKLAAAGVKVREGIPRGTAGLAAGAANHFREVYGRIGNVQKLCGLNVSDLVAASAQVEREADQSKADT